MAKLKLNEKIIKGSPLGEAVLRTQELSKLWVSLGKKLEKCYVSSLETSEFVVDPFLVIALVSDFESDPIIPAGLGREVLSELRTYVYEECRRIENSFEARLRSFCAKRNISLEGRFPSYILQGFLQVDVLQNEGACKIGAVKVKSLLMESVAPKILEILKEEAERSFDKSTFLEELYCAYERTTILRRLNAGDPVPIQDLFGELVFVKQTSKFRKTPIRSNYKEYTPELFQRDLAKVMKSGSNIVKAGKRLELRPTSFSHEAFPVFINSAIRYVGRIAFTEGVT